MWGPGWEEGQHDHRDQHCQQQELREAAHSAARRAPLPQCSSRGPSRGRVAPSNVLGCEGGDCSAYGQARPQGAGCWCRRGSSMYNAVLGGGGACPALARVCAAGCALLCVNSRRALYIGAAVGEHPPQQKRGRVWWGWPPQLTHHTIPRRRKVGLESGRSAIAACAVGVLCSTGGCCSCNGCRARDACGRRARRRAAHTPLFPSFLVAALLLAWRRCGRAAHGAAAAAGAGATAAAPAAAPALCATPTASPRRPAAGREERRRARSALGLDVWSGRAGESGAH